MRRMNRVRAALLATLVATLPVACADEPAAPEGGGTYPVVHAVLNPSRSSQSILVEEALVGTVSIDTTAPYNPREPILTGGGRPVSGAQVRVTGPLQQLDLEEMAFFSPAPGNVGGLRGDGSGRGVYFFLNTTAPGALPGQVPPPSVYMRVFPGDTFRLEIGWPDGSRIVTGETRIPRFSPLPVATPVTLNRDRDSLVIDLPGPAAALDAARYQVRVVTPYGPMTFFTDSARVRLSGALVNIDAPGAPRAFVPGFSQLVEIAAVDRNYFDYYRPREGGRGGTALISHLSGAGGLFGAYTPLGTRTVIVTADQDEPGEGMFARVVPAGDAATPRDTLELYRESGNRLTGQRRGGGAAGRRGNLLGTLDGTQVRLALVSFSTIRDTLATFTGRLEGTSIVGQFDDEAQAWTFQRAP